MSMYKYLLYLISILSFLSCSHSRTERLELALVLAGKNKMELLKVLHHYENDSLKYKAACYLIENMPYHIYYEGDEIKKYQKYFMLYADGKHSAKKIIDSLKIVDGIFSVYNLTMKKDIEEVDSAYLVRNIDFAFRVWREQPWGKHVTFDNFCKYILPYRIGNEPLTEWREEIYKKYNPLLDSIRLCLKADDPLIAAQAIMFEWAKQPYRWTSLLPAGPHVGPAIVEWKSGSCREYADGVVYLLRALGIPAGIDRAIQRGDNNDSHFWPFTIDKNGETYVSEPKVWTPANKHDIIKAKTARQTYELNWNIMEKYVDMSKLHPIFRFPLFEDVSILYAHKPHCIKIPVDKMYRKVGTHEPIYLCLSSRQNWKPIDFATIENGNVIFNNIEGGVVSVLAVWDNNMFEYISDPFLIDKETGTLHFFHPQKDKRMVNVYSKYNLNFGDYVYRMVGGVIEASNRSDFSDADTLYYITEFPYRLFTEVHSCSEKAYRYVRYRGGEKSFSNIGELYLFEEGNDSVRLKGKIIGTPGCYDNDGSHEYTNVFDDDPYTSFDYKYADGGWAGLDLGCALRIGRIVYVPRNRGNFVHPGQCFELYYFGKGKWNSLGIQNADSDVLRYEVPQNALLYLRNHTEGQDERIFEVKNGKQKFW